MKNLLLEKVKKQVPKGIIIAPGSSGNKVCIAVRKTESLYGLLSDQQKIQLQAIDAQDVNSVFNAPMVYKELESIDLGYDEIIPAEMGDPESLAKAEHEKILWMMDSSWSERPGVCKDGVGTGGNGRNGHALSQINYNKLKNQIRKNLREIGDYNLQRSQMESGDEKTSKKFVPVFVISSAVGGFGTGTLCPVLQLIRRQARNLKIPVKIIVMCLVSGSLEPADAQAAARNQELILRELGARFVGQYRDLNDNDPVHELICDSIMLISNANNDGEFADFDRLIALAAQHIFYYFHTPLGQKIQEKTVDIEAEWLVDELGGQRCVSTFGHSKIHLDKPRLEMCVANKLFKLFLDSVLARGKHPQTDKMVDIVSSETAISETELHSLALENVLRLNSLGKNDARSHAVAMFQQRAGNRRGFAGCCDVNDAGRFIFDVELPQRLYPQIKREALKLAEDGADVISAKVNAMLTDIDGISKAVQFLEGFAGPMDKFEKVNQDKLVQAQNNNTRIKTSLGRVWGMLRKLKAKFWLWRFFSFSTKKEILRVLPQITEKAIKVRLEISARQAIDSILYPRIRQVISTQLTHVHKISENISELNIAVSNEVKRLENFNPLLLVPVGTELVNFDFINKQFKQLINNENGYQAIADKIFEEFQSNYNSLDAFGSYDIDKIKATLLNYCSGASQRNLYHLNVFDVFKDTYQSDPSRKAAIAQAICESRGRLRLMGETDEIIPTMKFIAVNDRNVGQWVKNLTGQLDQKNGDWEFVEINDPNTILLFQQRSRGSLTRIINETSQKWQRPGNLRKCAQYGSDPFISLMPTAGLSQQELDTTIAMGMMTGQISKNHQGYQSVDHNGQMVHLGETPEQISRNIKDSYPHVVSIYRNFLLEQASKGTVDFKDILENQASCRLTGHLGEKPFIRAQKIADALLPYLSRLPMKG